MAPLRIVVVFRRAMKTQDYKAMLRAIEQALEVCDEQSGFMDEMHREICQGLRETRARLLRLIGSAELDFG